MKTITRGWTAAGTLLMLGLCLADAVAAESVGEGKVPLKNMSQAEYEQYRQKLDQQVKGVASGNSKQNASTAVAKEAAAEAEPESDSTETGNGYGKGYRARMERSGSASRAGGYRGGSMGWGGAGRNR